MVVVGLLLDADVGCAFDCGGMHVLRRVLTCLHVNEDDAVVGMFLERGVLVVGCEDLVWTDGPDEGLFGV